MLLHTRLLSYLFHNIQLEWHCIAQLCWCAIKKLLAHWAYSLVRRTMCSVTYSSKNNSKREQALVSLLRKAGFLSNCVSSWAIVSTAAHFLIFIGSLWAHYLLQQSGFLSAILLLLLIICNVLSFSITLFRWPGTNCLLLAVNGISCCLITCT